MANRKQRQYRAQADRIHTQTEINRRLHRSASIAQSMYFNMLHDKNGVMYPGYMAAVFSYLSDDLHELQELINKPAHTA